MPAPNNISDDMKEYIEMCNIIEALRQKELEIMIEDMKERT